ncbi:hypothetical protein [Haladaptatus salinisoli]|uniref:hypothetical protein n=1 Tax=Haladaptatus salinisoli TaxID=2884876 RepID=UPI001D0B6EBD|nr:hypothetical protein [Haladaptatus salinisoli]
MVNVQKEMRHIEQVEGWYREVFTEARILHKTWENIIQSEHYPLSENGYGVEEGTLNDMTERVESLLELYGSCPGEIPDDIRISLYQIYSDWYFSRAGGDWTYLPKNHDAKDSLDELIKRIEEESEDFGN